MDRLRPPGIEFPAPLHAAAGRAVPKNSSSSFQFSVFSFQPRQTGLLKTMAVFKFPPGSVSQTSAKPSVRLKTEN
jgi:hypothetical protein